MDPVPIDTSQPVFARLVERAQRLHVPIGVHLDITYRCDLDCVHCYLADRTRPGLSYETYARILRELKEAGTLFLLMSGGDLFMHPRGMDLVELARELRFETRLITHGGHISEQVADRIAAADVRAVGLSVYAANPDVHDAITRRPGSHTRTLRAIKRLVDRGVPTLMKCVIMDQNGDVVDEMRALASELGASLEFELNIKGDDGGDDALRALNLTDAEKARLLSCTQPGLADLFRSAGASVEAYTCMAGNASCYIAPNGDVRPCLEWVETAGNVVETPFETIWRESPVLLQSRGIRRGSFSGCTGCEHFSHCSLCPARAHRETGSPTGKAASKCEETAIAAAAAKLVR